MANNNQESSNPIKRGAQKIFRRNAITEVVRETSAGGVIYRVNKRGSVEMLLLQDPKGRWALAKGHVEPGEAPDETARREIKEETGLQEMKMHGYLGKINFKYRRKQSLILLKMHVYLVEALGDTDDIQKEDFMNGIGWFPATEAFELIEYDDIAKLSLIALKKIRSGNLD